MIPIIYIHFGDIPQYLVNSLEQAALYNEKILLLSDSIFKHEKVQCFPIKKFTEGIDLFESKYIHMSTNSAEFEIICIKRWFVLRNFMNDQNIEVSYYSDSDVMIYDNLSLVYQNYENYDAVYTLSESQENYRWAASACCSFWKKNTINKFCEFILNSYSIGNKMLDEKWNFHLNTGKIGGICDMTILYLFSKEINFSSLSTTMNNICFDQNILVSENYFKNEYKMINRPGENREQKELFWKNGLPYGYNEVYKKYIRFVALTEYAKLIGNNKNLFTKISDKIKSAIKKVIREKLLR